MGKKWIIAGVLICFLSLMGANGTVLGNEIATERNVTNVESGKTAVQVAAGVKYKTTANLNLRTNASMNAKVIRVIPKGASVNYLGKSGIWFKVSSGSTTGWASSTYLQKLSASGQVIYPAPSTKTPGTYVNGILVVNKKYALPSTYNPGVHTEAQGAVNAMLGDAKAQGLHVKIVSGYRSYSRQATLYNNYVKRFGKKEADRFSARPGHSEHQTGLAYDFGRTTSLTGSFGDTKEGKWLAANAHQYGFILRYPKGKENITGYMYEPWHFRYLGTENATKVKNSGKTLEEYLNVKGK